MEHVRHALLLGDLADDRALAVARGGHAERGGDGRLADAALAGHEDQALVEDVLMRSEGPAQAASQVRAEQRPARRVRGWKESRPPYANTHARWVYSSDSRDPSTSSGPTRRSASEPDPERQPSERRRPARRLEASLRRPRSPPLQKEVTACSGNGLTPDAGSGSQVQQQPPSPARRDAKVIAFANQKGGVAKTTTTLNLAVAFAEAGHRVLAVDMDPQGNLTMSQGIDPDTVEKSMYHVLVDNLLDPRGRSASARSTSPAPRSTWPAPRSR